jgi:hypothetical protein
VRTDHVAKSEEIDAMTKHIELKRFNQGTAIAANTLALTPLVIERLEEFKGSFDRLYSCAQPRILPPSTHSLIAKACQVRRRER